MKIVASVINGIKTATQFLKLFECLRAAFEAFESKAKELDLYKEETTNK
jgi:hypothetical protein